VWDHGDGAPLWVLVPRVSGVRGVFGRWQVGNDGCVMVNRVVLFLLRTAGGAMGYSGKGVGKLSLNWVGEWVE
jgi:hypothetical protein